MSSSPIRNSLYKCMATCMYGLRVAKFACPRVLDDQKMSEDNQKLRSGCPPDYQIFWEKYFENNSPYKFYSHPFLFQ